MYSQQKRAIKFDRTLAILRDPDAPFTAEAIYSLSDLMDENWEDFRALWPELSNERRRDLIARLVDTAETNFELDFGAIIYLALHDPDASVRLAAVEGALEDHGLPTVRRLLHLAQDDPYSAVRAGAARSLGNFVLQGELGKLPEHVTLQLQDAMLGLYNNLNEDIDVRRRALEAVSNCTREGVLELIREAYYADDLPMRVSAVFAMGRSCDEVWAPMVLEELTSEYPEMRFEAARAAGELELRKALPRLIELAYEDDREIQEAAIWALGEIGGKLARKALEQLASIAEQSEDDILIDAIQEAQAAASLSGDAMLPLFDFAGRDEESLDEMVEIDLDALDEDDEDETDGDEFYFDEDFEDYYS